LDDHHDADAATDRQLERLRRLGLQFPRPIRRGQADRSHSARRACHGQAPTGVTSGRTGDGAWTDPQPASRKSS